jgi:hypothetical protein
MTVPEALLERLNRLSPDDQRKVLDFAESLPIQTNPETRRINPWGLFRDRGIHLTAEQIDDARREVWSTFPRDFPDVSSQ